MKYDIELFSRGKGTKKTNTSLLMCWFSQNILNLSANLLYFLWKMTVL